MDGFTASVLFDCLGKGTDVNEAADLYKQIKGKDDEGPTEEARLFVEQNLNKPCKVRGTTHEGIVHRLNTATSGLYPGARFPVYVKITNEGNAKGMVFEYDLDQIEIVE